MRHLERHSLNLSIALLIILLVNGMTDVLTHTYDTLLRLTGLLLATVSGSLLYYRATPKKPTK